jgi:DNA-binding NarL/FixJ family response regulator
MSGQSLNAADSRALIVDICLLAGRGPVASVLICDDRPEVRLNLTNMLRPLPALVSITGVSDGFALFDAHTAAPADLILIGFHKHGSGAEHAMSLILGMDPSAVVIIVGSVDDAELLVNAYVRGARGLLLWDCASPAARVRSHHTVPAAARSPRPTCDAKARSRPTTQQP